MMIVAVRLCDSSKSGLMVIQVTDAVGARKLDITTAHVYVALPSFLFVASAVLI